MKGLKFRDKVIYVVNVLAAILLLVSYTLPYIPPESFAILAVLSLGVPLLIVLNILFCVYWVLRVKKQLFLSVLVLLLGYQYINALYKFSESKQVIDDDNISVMNYNVRLFNVYNWIPSTTIKEDIVALIENEQPDILCIQEYRPGSPIKLEGYYNFNGLYSKSLKSGLAVFSKFPIVHSGSLDFPDTKNNALFVDVVRKKDTIRVYNIHLQSSGINSDVDALKNESSENLMKRLSSTFKKQQSQTELILKHKASCSYRTIISGDFNNTAYSYVYRKLKGDFVDTFEEAGNGFGRTFDFKLFPLRIDFILVDDSITTNGFKVFKEKLSDHYPIKAILKL